MKPLRIGLIGYGFMGRTHSNAFTQVNNFFDLEYRPVLKALCARDPEKAKSFAAKWGYQSVETDWRRLVERDDIDLIDIAAPNNVHAEIAIAAAKAGKMILCEKPLALNGAEAEKMVAAVTKAKVPNMVWYNYRRVPAVTLAKQLIDEGWLGRIFHYRAEFLQDWTISADLPQSGAGLWRLDVKVAGSGVTGDLLAHCIDTALWLNGGIDSVTATTETFIKQRKHTLTGKVEKVGIDDASLFLARFNNGSLATFESTRYARGHKALYTFEIIGEYSGWCCIHITDDDHPSMKNWWVPGLQMSKQGPAADRVTDAVLKSACLDFIAKQHSPPVDDCSAKQTQRMGLRGLSERVIRRGETKAEPNWRHVKPSQLETKLAERWARATDKLNVDKIGCSSLELCSQKVSRSSLLSHTSRLARAVQRLLAFSSHDRQSAISRIEASLGTVR